MYVHGRTLWYMHNYAHTLVRCTCTSHTHTHQSHVHAPVARTRTSHTYTHQSHAHAPVTRTRPSHTYTPKPHAHAPVTRTRPSHTHTPQSHAEAPVTRIRPSHTYTPQSHVYAPVTCHHTRFHYQSPSQRLRQSAQNVCVKNHTTFLWASDSQAEQGWGLNGEFLGGEVFSRWGLSWLGGFKTGDDYSGGETVITNCREWENREIV